MKRLLTPLLCALATAMSVPVSAAVVVIVNLDGPGEGFNDPTPKSPEGGNPGTTLGAQRLILFQTAASEWGALLKSNEVIHVGANFDPLAPCGGGSGVLGSAGPTFFSLNSAAGPFLANTWYPANLLEARLNANINSTDNEISAKFNSSVDTGCVSPGTRFWYGIQPGSQALNTFALFPTVLHELGHGMGFLTLVCVSTVGCGPQGNESSVPVGSLAQGKNDIWTYFLANSDAQGTKWKDMNVAQRAASMILDSDATRRLVWTGPNATADIPLFQSGGQGVTAGSMRMYAPNPVQPGSSVSHWSTGATSPDLLMEPNLSAGIFKEVDLTYSVLKDIGWLTFPRDEIFPDNFDAN